MNGVWAVIDLDYGEHITAVYKEEIDALRVVNERGYGRVRFLEFGTDARGESIV